MLLKIYHISALLITCLAYKGYGQSNVVVRNENNSDSSFYNKNLNEVVVTGNYKPTGIDKSVVPTRIISLSKLSPLAAQNVADVLKYQANLRIQQDNILGTGLTMQGISGENVKILINGVPVNGRQNGNIDLGQLNVNNVERIEIVEGPLSVQYGTNALAGTINIITKKKPGKMLILTPILIMNPSGIIISTPVLVGKTIAKAFWFPVDAIFSADGQRKTQVVFKLGNPRFNILVI